MFSAETVLLLTIIVVTFRRTLLYVYICILLSYHRINVLLRREYR